GPRGARRPVREGHGGRRLDDLKDELKKAKKKAEKKKKELDAKKKKLDQAQGKISEADEIEIGGNLISGLLGAAPLVEDDEMQRYVNDVGFWIASQSKRKNLPWRFGVIETDGINAFAAPGGYIVVTLGLYSLLENEAQLAGVLGHEIAHVVRKHHLKALQKTMKREFWSDLTVKALSDKEDQKKMRELINAGVQLYATGLDREYEYDADLRGVVLAARAGYDPYALLDVLTTIDSINPDSEEMTVLMKTHPPTADRLSRLAKKMEGRMDQFASGESNPDRFREMSSTQ
ncbi:MAG: M48 family metalloprotease, partial [Pseudomonadota bacterium]